jgi:hypothetical protein
MLFNLSFSGENILAVDPSEVEQSTYQYLHNNKIIRQLPLATTHVLAYHELRRSKEIF